MALDPNFAGALRDMLGKRKRTPQGKDQSMGPPAPGQLDTSSAPPMNPLQPNPNRPANPLYKPPPGGDAQSIPTTPVPVKPKPSPASMPSGGTSTPKPKGAVNPWPRGTDQWKSWNKAHGARG